MDLKSLLESFKSFIETQNLCGESDFTKNRGNYVFLVRFIDNFPFREMAEVNEAKQLKLCLKVLDILSNLMEFYRKNILQYCFDFLLSNLSMKVCSNEYRLEILEIISKIIKNIKTHSPEFKTNLKVERIIEIILKETKSSIITPEMASKCFEIITLLFIEDESLLTTRYHVIIEVFDDFKGNHSYTELCKTAIFAMEKYDISNKFFVGILEWILNFNTLLEQDIQIEIEYLWKCLGVFLNKYQGLISTDNTFYNNLLKVLLTICQHSSKSQCRDYCFNLLHYVISQHFIEAPPSAVKETLEKLCLLPVDFEEWPKSNLTIFICIAYLVAINNNNFIWKYVDVFNTIYCVFYSEQRLSLNQCVLKSIYALYPYISQAFEFTLTGETCSLNIDILDHFNMFHRNAYLYTYKEYQLKWILSDGSMQLKQSTLLNWFARHSENDNKFMLDVVKRCKIEVQFLDFLVAQNEGTTNDLLDRIVAILASIKSVEISDRIARILPKLRDESIKKNLILCGAGVPVNTFDLIPLCSVMAETISFNCEPSLLRSSCSYSRKLLKKLIGNAEAFKVFYIHHQSLKNLIVNLCELDEITLLEVVSFLRALVIIQIESKIKVDISLPITIAPLIRGSQLRERLMVKFLKNLIVWRKISFISIDFDQFLDIFITILNIPSNLALNDVRNTCLIAMLKIDNDLTSCLELSIFIESMCLLTLDTVKSSNFKSLIFRWLENISGMPHAGFIPIPKSAIKSFVLKSVFVLSERQEIFELLEKASSIDIYNTDSC